jgi:cleavage stimulation factor subunit 2
MDGGAMSLAAAAANCRCSRVVYVGNIAFHASEKEVRDACELISPVRSLRLAADAGTGKRKGYAFVEYPDDETARSACRNLHGHALRGRELRVGLAGRAGRRGSGAGARGEHEPVGLEDTVHAASLVAGTPPLDSVTRFLAARSARELREIVGLLEGHGPDALRLLQEQVPGLAATVELARHLIDMAAADAAAEAARNKKRAGVEGCGSDDGDHGAKLRKVDLEEGGGFKGNNVAASAAGVMCF